MHAQRLESRRCIRIHLHGSDQSVNFGILEFLANEEDDYESKHGPEPGHEPSQSVLLLGDKDTSCHGADEAGSESDGNREETDSLEGVVQEELVSGCCLVQVRQIHHSGA